MDVLLSHRTEGEHKPPLPRERIEVMAVFQQSPRGKYRKWNPFWNSSLPNCVQVFRKELLSR